jgi:hypothetical protein
LSVTFARNFRSQIGVDQELKLDKEKRPFGRSSDCLFLCCS